MSSSSEGAAGEAAGGSVSAGAMDLIQSGRSAFANSGPAVSPGRAAAADSSNVPDDSPQPAWRIHSGMASPLEAGGWDSPRGEDSLRAGAAGSGVARGVSNGGADGWEAGEAGAAAASVFSQSGCALDAAAAPSPMPRDFPQSGLVSTGWPL